MRSDSQERMPRHHDAGAEPSGYKQNTDKLIRFDATTKLIFWVKWASLSVTFVTKIRKRPSLLVAFITTLKNDPSYWFHLRSFLFQGNKVEIQDVSAETLKSFLDFLYTDVVEEKDITLELVFICWNNFFEKHKIIVKLDCNEHH